ncbi:Uncharacterised protein [Salmonella enterica subsp. arizonae]|nr:Uncharacterised protein [Salmonella enterica subsp. arizonae]
MEFATWRNINGVKSQVEQMTTAQQAEYANEHGGQDLQLLYRTMGGRTAVNRLGSFTKKGMPGPETRALLTTGAPTPQSWLRGNWISLKMPMMASVKSWISKPVR